MFVFFFFVSYRSLIHLLRVVIRQKMIGLTVTKNKNKIKQNNSLQTSPFSFFFFKIRLQTETFTKKNSFKSVRKQFFFWFSKIENVLLLNKRKTEKEIVKQPQTNNYVNFTLHKSVYFVKYTVTNYI